MQYLTREELKAVLKNIPNERNRLMVLVTFHHGLRASETIHLRGKDIQGGHLHAKRGKGSLETVQPFVRHSDPELDEAGPLEELAAKIGPDELVFPMTRHGFYKLMRRTGTKAAIPDFKKIRPHILKHSIACQTIRKAGIENVRQRLGHKSIASTGEYLRVSDAEAARAIEDALA